MVKKQLGLCKIDNQDSVEEVRDKVKNILKKTTRLEEVLPKDWVVTMISKKTQIARRDVERVLYSSEDLLKALKLFMEKKK